MSGEAAQGATILFLVVAGLAGWTVLWPDGRKCPDCLGKGERWSGDHYRVCRRCGGTGRLARKK